MICQVFLTRYRFMFNQIMRYIPAFFDGLLISVLLSVIGMIIGTLLGIIVAYAHMSSNRVLKSVSNVYIEIFRNTPLLIQMYLLYFGLSQFGMNISSMMSATIALIINNSAYTSVLFETGIKSVETGQIEAATTLGMSTIQVKRYITIPQAFRIILGPLTSQFISLFLFSSVASTVGVHELLSQTQFVDSKTMRTFENYIVTTILYLLVTTIITLTSNLLERKLRIRGKGV